MKKIVFSFDDGLIDFYDITFPILVKYNICATFNVATGLVDNSVQDGYRYCSIQQIKELNDKGIEIAVHSNYHSINTTPHDLDLALEKLSEWVGRDSIYGIVIPYNIPPQRDIFKWMKRNRFDYIRGGDISKINIIHKILFRLHKLSKKQHYVNNNSRVYAKGKLTFIPSFPIWLDKDVDYYIKIIEMAPKDGIITFMFHSIYPTKEECVKAAYPEGAWTVDKFEALIKWILDNGFEIVTQKDSVCK